MNNTMVGRSKVGSMKQEKPLTANTKKKLCTKCNKTKDKSKGKIRCPKNVECPKQPGK